MRLHDHDPLPLSTHPEDPRQQWRHLVQLIQEADHLFEEAKTNGVSREAIEAWQQAARLVEGE